MLCGYKRAAEKWAARKSCLRPARGTKRGKQEVETREGFERKFCLMIVSHSRVLQPTIRNLSRLLRRLAEINATHIVQHCNLQAAFAENRCAVVFYEGHSFADVQSSAKDVDDVITDICGRCNDTLRVARSPAYPIISWWCEKKTCPPHSAIYTRRTRKEKKKTEMYAEAAGCKKVCGILVLTDISPRRIFHSFFLSGVFVLVSARKFPECQSSDAIARCKYLQSRKQAANAGSFLVSPSYATMREFVQGLEDGFFSSTRSASGGIVRGYRSPAANFRWLSIRMQRVDRSAPFLFE